MNAILDADRKEANRLLEERSARVGRGQAAMDLLEPALNEIGRVWETTGDISLAQAYVAAKVAEDYLMKAADEPVSGNDPETFRGTVVIGNIEDDFHSLGRKMVKVFLEKDGWQVIDLGNDVDSQAFVDHAIEHQAAFIAVSAMMFSTAMNIKNVRKEMDNRNITGKIKLVVGGAVFRLRPELVKEVEADGTAPNAILAPALFAGLSNSPGKKEGRNDRT